MAPRKQSKPVPVQDQDLRSRDPACCRRQIRSSTCLRSGSNFHTYATTYARLRLIPLPTSALLGSTLYFAHDPDRKPESSDMEVRTQSEHLLAPWTWRRILRLPTARRSPNRTIGGDSTSPNVSPKRDPNSSPCSGAFTRGFLEATATGFGAAAVCYAAPTAAFAAATGRYA